VGYRDLVGFGRRNIDPTSSEPANQTETTRRFEADSDAKAQLAATHRLDSLSQADFDAVKTKVLGL
jgi:hypothetical protein